MSPIKLGLTCVCVAAVPLIAISATGLGAGALITGKQPVSAGGATVGGARNGYLVELTEVYLSRNAADASHAVKSGAELAPVLFLNEELGQRGVKWRVRTIDGLDAQTYDVS